MPSSIVWPQMDDGQLATAMLEHSTARVDVSALQAAAQATLAQLAASDGVAVTQGVNVDIVKRMGELTQAEVR